MSVLLVYFGIWHQDWHRHIKNKNIMLTIVLFLTLLILCRVIYKSIDWFEKI